MREFVKLRLSEMDLSDISASTLWTYFNAVMQEAIKRFFPLRSVTNKQKKPLRMTGKVLRCIKNKYKLWRKWRESTDGSLEVEYKNRRTKQVRR